MSFPTREELRVLAREKVIQFGSVNRAIEEIASLVYFHEGLNRGQNSPEDIRVDIIDGLASTDTLDAAIAYLSGEHVSDGFSDYSDESAILFADAAEANTVIFDSLSSPSGCHEALNSLYWDQLLAILADHHAPLALLFDSANKIMSYDQAFQIGELILKRFLDLTEEPDLSARVVTCLARAAVFARKDLLTSFACILRKCENHPVLQSPLKSWMSRKCAADALYPR